MKKFALSLLLALVMVIRLLPVTASANELDNGLRYMVYDDHVEITDVLAAPSDRPAHVRWTMVSDAKPSLTPEGIVLEKKGVKMLLKAEGADVRYMIWSSDPQAYDSPLRHLDAPNPNTYICGYEVDVPASVEYTIRISMNKVQ